MNHHGSFEELEAAVKISGIIGEWQVQGQNGVRQFRGRAGEIVNWWPSKGTLQFQGKYQEEFRKRLEEAFDSSSPPEERHTDERVKIFLVHGHDREARDQLELVLRKLGLEPFILQVVGQFGFLREFAAAISCRVPEVHT